ncbi:hypothetical protein KA005_33120 [bacterium]|nr:hypothetical protein [bacterium]
MKDLLDKLSSYNIFNYLLPGIIFVVLAEKLTSFSFVQKDIILGVFLYYFIGMVISRIGSLTIEPTLKKLKFISFASYPQFVAASKQDDKIDILSEANNMYRTFCSVFLFLIVLKCYELISKKYPGLDKWSSEVLIIGLLVLFLFSYRKQTKYITKRVASLMNKKE